MDRVFLDANVLFSAAYRPLSQLRKLWQIPGLRLLTSPYVAAEACRNIQRKCPEGLDDLLDLLHKCELILRLADSPAGSTLPAKDLPVLRAAIAARATHLLTGDSDFALYRGRTIVGVMVLTPSDYLKARGD